MIDFLMDGAPSKWLLQRQPSWHSPYSEPDAGAGAVHTITVMPKNKKIGIGFVSTNSITQGEQAGIFWPRMFGAEVSIQFAHRTFQWNSEARGAAAVHCVIIGLNFNAAAKRQIFDYAHVRGEPHVTTVKTINGYLIDGPQYSVPARTNPPDGFLRMHKGSQPTDGARLKKPGGGYVTTSNLILEDADKKLLIKHDPKAKAWLRPFVGGDELISGEWRWCLWLKDAKPADIKASKPLAERLGSELINFSI